MKDIEHLIEEMLGNPTGQQYPAASESPRKDFVPYSNKNSYAHPYQQNTNPVNNPANGIPSKIASMPWPLENITSDLADSYLSLLTAGNKLNKALTENPSLDKHQKQKLKKYLRACRDSLISIRNIGTSIIDLAKLN